MKFTDTCVTLASICLIGCREPVDLGLHKRLQKLAGTNAFDCGRATTDAENIQQSACALDRLNNKTPFFVQYRMQGIDAISEQGFSLDSKGTLVSISAFSWGPAASVGKFEVRSCDPHKLRKTRDEVLICY